MIIHKSVLNKSTTIDTQQIIQSIRKRDQNGLSHLYKNYSASIFGIISRTVKEKEIAEEVLQQTMLKVWDKIDQFDDTKSSLFTWISVIARNTAIDKVRLKSYQNRNKTEDIEPHVYDYGHSENNSSKIDVQRLTLNLDPKYKIVLDKMYLEGYSQSDIAKELDIPLGTVKTRLRKAISILRNELKDEKKLFLGMLMASLLILLTLWL